MEAYSTTGVEKNLHLFDKSRILSKLNDSAVHSCFARSDLYLSTVLLEKCPNTVFFLVRIFQHYDWIRGDRCLTLFSPISVKLGPEKTPYLDTFHAMLRISHESCRKQAHCTKNEIFHEGFLHYSPCCIYFKCSELKQIFRI